MKLYTILIFEVIHILTICCVEYLHAFLQTLPYCSVATDCTWKLSFQRFPHVLIRYFRQRSLDRRATAKSHDADKAIQRNGGEQEISGSPPQLVYPGDLTMY